MSQGFFVNTDAMRAHAANVDSLGTSAGRAVAAAESVNFSSQMYGTIGALLLLDKMMPLQNAGVLSTKAIQACLGDTAEAVRMTAQTFDFVDREVGEVMTKLKG
jgi:hypothetical protein